MSSPSSDRYATLLLEVADAERQILTLPVDTLWTGAKVKTEIKQKTGVDAANITLTFGGKLIGDNDILQLLGIKNNSKIVTQLQVNGGWSYGREQHNYCF